MPSLTANALEDHRQERASVSVRCIAGLCGQLVWTHAMRTAPLLSVIAVT